MSKQTNTENKGLISVIIPVYNAAKFINQTLDSILEQTYPYWEAVLVNDGSTDNSLEIIKNYAAKDKRFKIIDKKNERVAAARNDGLKKASGQYITFLDADDMWYPQFLEFMLQALQQQNADMVWCKYAECAETSGLNARNFYDYIPNTIECPDILKQFAMRLKPKATILVWDKLYRAELLQNLSFSNDYKNMAEDYHYTIQVFARHPKSVYIATPLIAYRQSANSASHQKLSYTAIDSHICLLNDCMQILKDYQPKEAVDALQRRLIPIIYRFTCTYPYFRAPQQYSKYWQHYLPICRQLIDKGLLKLNMLPVFQRFLYNLYITLCLERIDAT